MQWVIGIIVGVILIGGAIYLVVIGNRAMAACLKSGQNRTDGSDHRTPS